MVKVSVRQALEKTSKTSLNAEFDDWLERPAYELICTALFEIANNGGSSERGALSRAVSAQKVIANRLVGLRKPGTAPVTREDDSVDFIDMAGEVTRG